MALVIEQLDIVDGRPLSPADFSRLGGEPACRRWGRDIGDIHIQGHGEGSMGIGGSLKGLVDQSEQRPAMGHAEKVFHIGSQFHLDLRISLSEIDESDAELPCERLCFYFFEDRFFHA